MIRAGSTRTRVLRWVGALAVLQTTAGCSLDYDYLRGNGLGENAGDSGSSTDFNGIRYSIFLVRTFWRMSVRSF